MPGQVSRSPGGGAPGGAPASSPGQAASRASAQPGASGPAYPIGTKFAITLGEGKTVHGTVASARWVAPGLVPANALPEEASGGAWLYTLTVAEYEPPRNTWTGTEGLIRQGLAGGVFQRG